MYIMWFKKEKYFNMVYFCIFICSTLVIIWHDPNLGFNGYHLYLLIVSHHILALANFYTLFVLKYNVDKTGYLKATIFSLSVYGAVALITYLIGSSYIFTSGLPDLMYDIYPF